MLLVRNLYGGLGFRFQDYYIIPPRMENQMEEKMENDMEVEGV